MMVLGLLEVYLGVGKWMRWLGYFVVEWVQGDVDMVFGIMGYMVDGSCCCTGCCKVVCRSEMQQLARPCSDNS